MEVPRCYLVRSVKKSLMIIKKNQNWNDRMNYFIRNLNDYFKQHKTLYIEKKHITNKEKIEDRRGLWNSYSPSAFYKIRIYI